MPDTWSALARSAAQLAGFAAFAPDVCLINRYAPGARLALHQDKDEADFGAPIVSVSLGLPATFVLGGLSRGAPTHRLRLSHGDVLVWGGPARLRYHAILPLGEGMHADAGPFRFNLTFRKAR
jgi:alkylated DNA repair protein (DNA oxidative demethylase)